MEIKRTLRQRKFIKAYIENGGNATKAYLAMNPDYKGKWAAELGRQNLIRLDISVTELLDKMGTTDFNLNQKLREGLDATKVISVTQPKRGKGRPRTKDLPKGKTKNIKFVTVPDFNVIAKYLDMAYKLKNKYPAEKHKVEVDEGAKTLDTRQKLIDKIDKLSAKIEEEKKLKKE